MTKNYMVTVDVGDGVHYVGDSEGRLSRGHNYDEPDEPQTLFPRREEADRAAAACRAAHPGARVEVVNPMY